ncbi:MAG: hypothetical protein JWM80_6042 [Cyanobacteria bacterium RYN_339]|nr:hypothetical protein [Cyanobacteria bacterium RYN_339]
MSTGQLHGKTGRLQNLAARARDRKQRPGLESLFQTPVPPFHVVYPTPNGFSTKHPIYAMHRAANRIYNDRQKIYRRKGISLSAPDLVDFIRDDVMSNILAVERQGWGPFALDTYLFLKGSGLHAWLPAHRDKAEAMLMEFRRTYRKRKERVSVLANNDVWGARPQDQPH